MAIARAQHEPVDDVLDDRLDVAGDVPQGAAREPAAARLVAREPRSVDEEDARSRAGEVDRRGGSGRPCSDHEHVEALHAAIVGSTRHRDGQCSLASHRRRTDTRGADDIPFGHVSRTRTDAASFE